MTTIINTKLGESKNVTRLWLEGEKLARAGVKIGSQYELISNKAMARAELREVSGSSKAKLFTVSKRDRRGNTVPLIEVRSDELRDVFQDCERLRVAIRNGRIVITAHHQDTKVAERVRRLVEKMRAGEALSVASLFHGGGVLDRALHSGLLRAGVKSFVQVGVEIEPEYLDSSLRNNPMLWKEDSVAICSDIRDVNWGHNPPQCDLLVAGIPCVAASRAGRSKNKISCAEEHTDAGALFVDYLDAVKAMNPSVVLIENVPEYQKTASMMVIRSVLTTLGYELSEATLDGNDFGALERRRRFVLVGMSKGLNVPFDFSTLKPVRAKEPSLQQILDDVPLDSQRWKPFEYLALKEIRDKAAGKGFSRQLLTGTEGHCGTIGKSYAKCRSTEPFLVHPVDPSLSRLFTPAEHARLKTIPEDMFSGASETQMHEMSGQSVIFTKFEAVGLGLGEVLNEAAGVMKKPVMQLVSVCQQVCGGGNCATGPVCPEGVDPLTELPADQYQLAMAV